MRRIEAVTGKAALDWLDVQGKLLQATAEALKAPAADLPNRVTQLLEDRKKLEREVADLRKQVALGGSGSSGASEALRDINGVAFISLADRYSRQEFETDGQCVQGRIKSGVIALVASSEGKVSPVVAVTEDLTQKSALSNGSKSARNKSAAKVAVAVPIWRRPEVRTPRRCPRRLRRLSKPTGKE